VRDTPYPPSTGSSLKRQHWFARDHAEAWAVVLDAGGKITWGPSDVGGDPLLVVLTQAVSDSHLAGLRQDDVSYIFAGEREIDLPAALETLNREVGICRLLLEGGGSANGALLQPGWSTNSAWWWLRRPARISLVGLPSSFRPSPSCCSARVQPRAADRCAGRRVHH
jgi:hypothetical protein